MTTRANYLIWLDLEMTGLDLAKDRIIEIATLITDNDLNIIAQGPVFAISQPQSLLDSMDKWNSKQHAKSGLLDRVKVSTITEEQAEAQTLAFLSHYVPKGTSPMCGNSICTDRRYLYQYMPILEQYFHYRNLDVSTVKELARRWCGETIVSNFEKSATHLALEDIKESIAELQYYRQHMFVSA